MEGRAGLGSRGRFVVRQAPGASSRPTSAHARVGETEQGTKSRASLRRSSGRHAWGLAEGELPRAGPARRPGGPHSRARARRRRTAPRKRWRLGGTSSRSCRSVSDRRTSSARSTTKGGEPCTWQSCTRSRTPRRSSREAIEWPILRAPHPGVVPRQFCPSTDLSTATCVWEVGSVEAAREYADSTLGDSSQNRYFEINTEYALGVPEPATAKG